MFARGEVETRGGEGEAESMTPERSIAQVDSVRGYKHGSVSKKRDERDENA